MPVKKGTVKKVKKSNDENAVTAVSLEKIKSDISPKVDVEEVKKLLDEKNEYIADLEKKASEERERRIWLVREDGILRIGDESEIKKNEWQYKMTDATKKYTILDLDNGKAQPMVKSILNDLELFPELRMLKMIQVGMAIIFVIVLVLLCTEFVRQPSKSWMEGMEKRISDKSVTKPEDVKSRIEQVINRVKPGETTSQTGSGRK